MNNPTTDTAGVQLTWDQVRSAAYVGLERYVDALAAGTASDGSAPTWDAYIEDALGEWAVAKLTNSYQFLPVDAAPGLWTSTLVGVGPDGLAYTIGLNDAGGHGPGNPT